MKTSMKKIVSLLVAAIMAFSVFTGVLMMDMTEIQADLNNSNLELIDQAWEMLDEIEKELLASKASMEEVIDEMFAQAEACELVDANSVKMVDEDTFEFTVSGMKCMYDYRLATTVELKENPETSKGKYTLTPRDGNTHTDLDILLVAPYYGLDANFTDKYIRTAQDLADYTGGTVTILERDAATGPEIAANFTGKSVVIFDSHGIANGDSTYLCLTNPSGITPADYTTGRAVNVNGNACIDGRYIQTYVDGDLGNCFVWMALCEGMKLSGHGTTGNALLEAGAGAVLGYSQNVTFVGEYMYSQVFWQEMQYGRTAAEAFETMVTEVGDHDYYGTAYPVLMSATDAFPAMPDSPQHPTSDWTLTPISGEPENTPDPVPSTSPDPTIPEGFVNVRLTVGAINWGDGSGYQMLLDASANAYGTYFPESGPLTEGGNAPAGLYEQFEYKIPENADGYLDTPNMLHDNETALITIPAGVYDYFLANPTPGQTIWGVSSNGHFPGRYDNFEFISGKTYEFVIGRVEGFDGVSLFVDGVEVFPPEDEDLVVGWYFEMPAELYDWTMVDSDGDGENWRQNVSHSFEPAYEGHGCLVSASYINGGTVLDPDNWAITPEFYVPTGETVSVNWYAGPQDQYQAYWDNYGVYIGYGEDITQYDELFVETIDYPNYTAHTIDISAYAGQNVHIAFRHFDSINVYEVKIDNVEIRTGEIEVVTPEPPVTPHPNQIAGWTFETQAEVDNWTMIDSDGDGENWRKNISHGTEPAYAGKGCLVSASYINDGTVLFPDNWAISPEFTIPANSNAMLSWYVGPQSGTYHMEQYTVYVGTGTDTANYTPIFSEVLCFRTYVMHKIDLSEYAGQTISIAFRHHDSSDNLSLKIDNVMVVASEDDNPMLLPEGIDVFGYDLTAGGWSSFNTSNTFELNMLAESDIDFIAAEYVDGIIYAIDTMGDLYRVDPATWAPTLIADCGSNTTLIIDLALDHETGIVYALAETTTAGRILAEIDLTTGALTTVLNYSGMYIIPGALACTGNGIFVSNDLQDDTIYSYNLEGTINKIADGDYYGNVGAQSMMYNPEDGMVYWASKTYYNQFLFYQIDVEGKTLTRYDYIGMPTGHNFAGIFMLPGEISEIIPGDVDGDGSVSVSDGTIAIRHALGLENLTGAAFAAADIDGNGRVSVTEATTIIRMALGL